MLSKNEKNNSGAKTVKFAVASLVILSVFVLILGLFGIGTSQALTDSNKQGLGQPPSPGENSCTQTTHAAFLACQHEKTDDHWIAVGNCVNLSDPGAREECFLDAKAEFKQAREECSDQKEARHGICEELGEAPYDPQIDPANFVDPRTATPNEYFPLVPGTIRVYKGGPETITVTVTGEIKEILGVPCIIVYDVVKDHGEIIEDTEDWYAQDQDGNVWYFGELSKGFENGELVSLEGSWKAGVDSAKPGIVMEADPRKGDLYRQEFSLGNAEDLAKVVSRGEESVSVRYGEFTEDVLKTEDFTPIQPDVKEFKYYAPGVGVVLEVNPDTGERTELVRVTP